MSAIKNSIKRAVAAKGFEFEQKTTEKVAACCHHWAAVVNKLRNARLLRHMLSCCTGREAEAPLCIVQIRDAAKTHDQEMVTKDKHMQVNWECLTWFKQYLGPLGLLQLFPQASIVCGLIVDPHYKTCIYIKDNAPKFSSFKWTFSDTARIFNDILIFEFL